MSVKEESLYHLRKSVKDFLFRIKEYDISSPIVEVGKMLSEGKVYKEYPEFYVDTKEMFSDRKLIHMDIDGSTTPDICDDILNIDRHFKPGQVGAVILLHVLEHVSRFWEIPEKLFKILKPEGLVFIQTPWNFRFHGPRPDCWRISDDGYEILFKDYFDIVVLEKYNPFNDYLHPLVLNVILKKKPR